MIVAGIKTEEYREIKEYWARRFMGHDNLLNPYFFVRFRNGYSANAPVACYQIKEIIMGDIRPEWGDGMTGRAFVIKLGKKVSNEFIEELMYMK